jgi:hypothetical protein
MKYSETSINRHSFNRQFLLTASPYSMYSNQIAAKNHPRFTAERRRRRSGALLFCWWVTFLARLEETKENDRLFKNLNIVCTSRA